MAAARVVAAALFFVACFTAASAVIGDVKIMEYRFVALRNVWWEGATTVRS